VGGLAAIGLAAMSVEDSRYAFPQDMSNLQIALGGTGAASDGEKQQYQEMQAAIPIGSTLLARVDKPYLLDFKRNSIYVADVPGAASPPPGLPMFRGADEIADYLLSVSVRYVAYSYGDDAGFSRSSLIARQSPDSNKISRVEAMNIMDFGDALVELGRTRTHVYDDSANFVLDLAETAGE
jgi:hypothetical protein